MGGGGATPPITPPQGGLQGLPMPGMPPTAGAAMAMGGPPPQVPGQAAQQNAAMQPTTPIQQSPTSLANAMQAMQLVQSAVKDAQQSQAPAHPGYGTTGPKGALNDAAQIAMMMGGG
jgi:hypothetical protein